MRPVLAFLTLAFTAFLLAPTVASVHEKIDELTFDRPLPFQLFKWIEDPRRPPLGRPDCDYKDYHLESEVTGWPELLRKNDSYTISGHVGIAELNRRGVYEVDVDIFLNDTKELPGIKLGSTRTLQDGTFMITGVLPVDLQAEHYHIVAHAYESRLNCWILREHWSDPELNIVAATRIELDEMDRLVVGREALLQGTLLDEAGGPVRDSTVVLTIGGRSHEVDTDGGGRFLLNWTPSKPGNLTIDARYRGNEYYDPSTNRTTVRVLEEDFVLTPASPAFVRSQPTTLSGEIYVAEPLRGEDLTLEISGDVRMIACPDCRATNRFSITPDDAGRFSVTLTAPSNETPGNFTLTFADGGLKKLYVHNASLDVQPVLSVRAKGTGLFSRGYEVNATLTDEEGRPLDGALAISAVDTWRENRTGADGAYAFSSSAPCGHTGAHAFFNGTGHLLPARGEDRMTVCTILAIIPAWVLDTPWWVWVVSPLALLGAWALWRGMRQRYAATLTAGPPLTISFTEPHDDAIGYASPGETIEATAFLEQPLPDGHRLRMGVGREVAERPLDEKLRAHLLVTPSALGEFALRAEILDARGRVVTRRTIKLQVVRYAQEIEARYLALRAKAGASDTVTPREFETWLRRRAPALDAETARRLVRVFEEADYSPRDAGRADFAAYLAAERGVQEVSPDAMV